MVIVNKKEKPFKAFAIASQFAYNVIGPLLVFIYGGQLVKNLFDFGDAFMTVCVILGIAVMIIGIISFIIKLIRIYDKDDKDRYKWIKSDYND